VVEELFSLKKEDNFKNLMGRSVLVGEDLQRVKKGL
jgi:hypothetical protein